MNNRIISYPASIFHLLGKDNISNCFIQCLWFLAEQVRIYKKTLIFYYFNLRFICKLAYYTKISLFKTAELLYFISSLLLILVIGRLGIIIAWILIAVAFYYIL